MAFCGLDGSGSGYGQVVAVAHAVTNLRIAQNAGNFLTNDSASHGISQSVSHQTVSHTKYHKLLVFVTPYNNLIQFK
jgi:hypothetical protein